MSNLKICTFNKELLDQMQTGDALLFHGSGYWFSYIVEWATWSSFSHVGMVLRDPTYIDPKLKGIYMLESGAESFPDAVDHKICWGVQIVNLEKVLSIYDGRIYYRKLKCAEHLRSNFGNALSGVWDKIKGLPYDDSPWDLLRAELEIPCGDRKRTDTFFCSALLTFLYDHMKLFEKPVEWDMILPKDYDDQGKIEPYFNEETELSPKVLLKF